MTEIPETTEIPRDFASINRRAKKMILSGQAADALIEKYNAFAKAVIDCVDEDTITALADELEDAYHDSRAELS